MLITRDWLLTETPMSRGQAAWGRRYRLWLQFRHNKLAMAGLIIAVLLILLSLLAPVLATYDPGAQDLGNRLARPSAAHWLGTDELGRDVYSRLLYGGRITLGMVVAVVILVAPLGLAIGCVAGYAGGIWDRLLMRVTDIFLVLPWLVLMLTLAALLGPSLANIIAVIGLTGWTGTARIVRAQTLSVKERPFVERAVALGAGDLHVIRRHVLPNVFSLIFANTVLVIAVTILSETSLSFLGMGDPASVSWGSMLYHAFDSGAAALGANWYLLPPGLCVVGAVMAFTFVGQALDEVLNPRVRGE